MASPEDIAEVRLNANELTDANYSDEVIGELVDSFGVEGASATLWDRKAATAASAVDVTEAGASHKFSDLYKNYTAQAKYWWDRSTAGSAAPLTDRPRVTKIVRQ